MKISLLLCFAVLAVAPAHAQMFRPEGAQRSSGRAHVSASRGGDYNHRHDRGHDYGRGYFAGPRYSHGAVYPYGHIGYRYVPSYGYYSGYGYGYPYYGSYGYYSSGSSAVNGLVLGALAGGIIGHNSGDFRHNGWRGAAWGAGAGWLLGSVLDAHRPAVVYRDSTPVVVPQQPVTQVQSQPVQSQPQQVTIINNYYGGATPMSGVNGMFGR